MNDIQRATPEDAGCYIDGHCGHYATARAISIAADFGFSDAEALDLANRYGTDKFDDDEFDALVDASDDAIQWLNDHVAPENFYWGWYDGELFLQSIDWWDEDVDLIDQPTDS